MYELDKLLSIGVSPDRMSYGNTIKKSRDIAYFYEKGVRMYVNDNIDDLRNIAREAPGSKVFFRILTEGAETADWPLSRKFGLSSGHGVRVDRGGEASWSGALWGEFPCWQSAA